MAYKDPEEARVKARAYYQRTREEQLAKKGAYYAVNRERILADRKGVQAAAQRKYREANREKLRESARERARERQARDPEAVRETTRRWRAANPEKIREYNQADYARYGDQRRAAVRAYKAADPERERARRMYRAHGLWPEDWAAIWESQAGRCYLGGEELEVDKTHVDHDHSHCPPGRSCRVCQRGLACNDCNVAIGIAGDDPARLRRMADALEAAQNGVKERMATAIEQLPLAE